MVAASEAPRSSARIREAPQGTAKHCEARLCAIPGHSAASAACGRRAIGQGGAGGAMMVELASASSSLGCAVGRGLSVGLGRAARQLPTRLMCDLSVALPNHHSVL